MDILFVIFYKGLSCICNVKNLNKVLKSFHFNNLKSYVLYSV